MACEKFFCGNFRLKLDGENIEVADKSNSHIATTTYRGLPYLMRYYHYLANNNNISREDYHVDTQNYLRVFGEYPPHDFMGNYVKESNVADLIKFINTYTPDFSKKYTEDELEKMDYRTIKVIYEFNCGMSSRKV